jgi:hypothetical protein
MASASRKSAPPVSAALVPLDSHEHPLEAWERRTMAVEGAHTSPRPKERTSSGAKCRPPCCRSPGRGAGRRSHWRKSQRCADRYLLLAPVPEAVLGNGREREEEERGAAVLRVAVAGGAPAGAASSASKKPPPRGTEKRGAVDGEKLEGNRCGEARRPWARRRSPAGSFPAPSPLRGPPAAATRSRQRTGDGRESVGG